MLPVPMPAGDQSNCAVFAQDGLGNDISSSIAYATSNPTCSPAFVADVRCPLCAVQYMQQGLCLPGRCDPVTSIASTSIASVSYQLYTARGCGHTSTIP